MSTTTASYRPVSSSSAQRRQALRVWSIALALAGGWVLLTLVPTAARAFELDGIASPLFNFFGYICHQLPDRSFHIMGEQFGVCSRCFGVYAGLLAGIVVYPLWRRVDDTEPIARFWLFLSLVPVSIDWSLTAFRIWENTQASRFITGAILGIACATFIMPAAVEIVRNLSRRSGRRNAGAS